MKRPGSILTLILAISLLTAPAIAEAAPEIQVCFSPATSGACDPQATIVKELDSARKEVLVQAYVLTARPIVRALIAAHRRGVDVRVILDRKELRGDRDEVYGVRRLLKAKIPVAIDEGVRGIAHNKVMVIDDGTVITGSYNFTWSAEHKNAENLLVIRDPALAARYASNWRTREAHSEPLKLQQGS